MRTPTGARREPDPMYAIACDLGRTIEMLLRRAGVKNPAAYVGGVNCFKDLCEQDAVLLSRRGYVGGALGNQIA
jgi:hypothetical protein